MAQKHKLPTVSSFHLYVIDMALKLLIDAVPYAMSYDVMDSNGFGISMPLPERLP